MAINSNNKKIKGISLFKPSPLNDEDKKNAKIALIFCIVGIMAFIVQMLYFLIRYKGIDDWLVVLIFWIVFIMPGYIADAMMALVGGGAPIDGGKIDKDGRRLFGSGKTKRGFLLGPFIGAIIALCIHGILYWQWESITVLTMSFTENPDVYYHFYENNANNLIKDLSIFLLGNPSGDTTFLSFIKLIPRVVLCSYGTAFGDLFGSWAKRRKNIPSGQPFWVVDQIDFLAGCLLFAGWFVFIPPAAYTLHVLIMLLIITPSLAVISNSIAYLIGIKSVPW
jgi:CDP-2,3-bis-(O-geranylgeranyl)-sn-glycerol synthase